MFSHDAIHIKTFYDLFGRLGCALVFYYKMVICHILPYFELVRLPYKLELIFMKHYAPNRCLYIKVAKLKTGVGNAEMSHNFFFGGGGASGGGGGGQGRCEQRSEVFVKIQQKKIFFFLGGGGGGQVGGILGGGGGGKGSQGGCEQRIEVFVKIQNKIGGWGAGMGVGGVRVDVTEK